MFVFSWFVVYAFVVVGSVWGLWVMCVEGPFVLGAGALVEFRYLCVYFVCHCVYCARGPCKG